MLQPKPPNLHQKGARHVRAQLVFGVLLAGSLRSGEEYEVGDRPAQNDPR
jgi:hypothetical protein